MRELHSDLILGIVLLFSASGNSITAAAGDATIILPAMTKRMVTEGQPSTGSTITMQQIGNCMGVDSGIRQKAQELEAEGNMLSHDDSAFETEAEHTQLQQNELELATKRHELSQQDIDRRSQALEKERKAIAELQQQRPLSAKMVDEAKQRVARFNASVTKINADRESLQKQQTTLTASIDRLNARINTQNANANSLNLRKKAYNDKVDQFNRDTAGFTKNCTGERRIER